MTDEKKRTEEEQPVVPLTIEERLIQEFGLTYPLHDWHRILMTLRVEFMPLFQLPVIHLDDDYLRSINEGCHYLLDDNNKLLSHRLETHWRQCVNMYAHVHALTNVYWHGFHKLDDLTTYVPIRFAADYLAELFRTGGLTALIRVYARRGRTWHKKGTKFKDIRSPGYASWIGNDFGRWCIDGKQCHQEFLADWKKQVHKVLSPAARPGLGLYKYVPKAGKNKKKRRAKDSLSIAAAVKRDKKKRKTEEEILQTKDKVYMPEYMTPAAIDIVLEYVGVDCL